MKKLMHCEYKPCQSSMCLPDDSISFGLKTFGLKTFGLKTFGLKTFGLKTFCLKTFCLKTFCLKTFGLKTFDLKTLVQHSKKKPMNCCVTITIPVSVYHSIKQLPVFWSNAIWPTDICSIQYYEACQSLCLP